MYTRDPIHPQGVFPAQNGAGRVTSEHTMGEVAFGRRAGLRRGECDRPPPVSLQDMNVAATGGGGRAPVPGANSPGGKLGCPLQPDHAKRAILPHSIPVDNAILQSKRVMTFGAEEPMQRFPQPRLPQAAELVCPLLVSAT